ncbi:fatty acid desaturase [Shimia aestuarii]|uniref:Fatty acid desaturase n=1 Tax=Shimia aestuarii TaxID=254406 RepID=A0A1I4QYD3_9RHOB|nr:fatty acid desaturase [Shimia aestuarii]SFM45048.1 Fatty acid desaturase [Shimia aestuarii]
MRDMHKQAPVGVEWPTLGLVILCYGAFVSGTVWLAAWWLPAGMVVTALALALHSSLSHEVLHGHPFRSRFLSEALVFPAIGLFIPYIRFRDTHLAHHLDSRLTDPYDDPESNYQDPAVWAQLPAWRQKVLTFNNTLAGRLLIGPLVAQEAFMRADWRAIRAGDRAVLKGWLWHIPSLVLALWWMLSASQLPVWAYLVSAYCALSILKIRTFLEHQAHERARGRTVIIEDKGPLAWIFLNNNLHVVHHMHPRMPWYRLPVLFRENRDRYLSRNDGYYYRSYGEVFRRYLWARKDPVPHPLWPKQ